MDIIHGDLDAFFASVEQRDYPELKGKPVIVGSPPDSRGVVSTCSYEARLFGIRSAMPSSQAYRLCPQAIFIPPDMKRYQQASRKVFHIFNEYTPDLEPLSIDEAFLDVSGCHRLFGSSLDIGMQIRSRVKEECGLNISIGIGPNKFLAKLATNLCKPDNIMEFTPQMVNKVLPGLSVSHLWGIGTVSARRLNQHGIYTFQDLREAPYELCANILGSNTDFILGMAWGMDSRPVAAHHDPKSIGSERTFATDINDPELIESMLRGLSEKVGLQLRRSSLKAQSLSLKLRTPSFETITRTTTITNAVDDNQSLFEMAWYLFNNSGLKGKALRLIGVSASRLIEAGWEQPSLFVSDATRSIDPVIDRINQRFSNDSVYRGLRRSRKETNAH